MQQLMDHLAEALTLHGHGASRDVALEGRSGTVYTIPLLAEVEQRAFVIEAHLDGLAPAQAMEHLAMICDDVGADGAILCHLEAAESHDTTVHLWGRDDLIRILGGARLADAVGIDLPALKFEAGPRGQEEPIVESLSDLMPPAFAEEALDLDALEGLDMLDIQPAEEPVPEPTAYAHPLLPVVVTAEEAQSKVRERLFHSDHVETVLQPVHLMDYECDLLAEGSLRYDTVNGRLQVHGTDKSVIEVDREAVDPAGFTKVSDVSANHERALRTSNDRAKERATHFLMETHTRVVDVQVASDEGSFDYTEKKKVAPRPDHVRLHHLGVFYRVLWRVHGPNGHVDVDGLTGELVQETLQTPDPDALILD